MSKADENILVELNMRYKDECQHAQNRLHESSDRKLALKQVTEEQLWLLSTL